MDRDPRYDILFEPLAIGPVTTRNRFYQVPHCNGMGRPYPNGMIGMRGMKAEGGWGIVCTEQCDFQADADIAPNTDINLWDDGDAVRFARMAEAVHRHGGLAGIEFAHNGQEVPNLYSREVPIGPMDRPANYDRVPIQARAMDLSDIRAYRRSHRRAVLRARDAGFDIVVVYAGHDGTMPYHFLSPRHNQRSDEYGGSLENRLRLFRELLEETKEAVGDTMGIIVRFAVDEMMGPEGLEWHAEGREAIEMLAELPDLWDVNVSDWTNDSKTSRFAPEGYQEEYVAFVKQVTTKPVATVGRYTSPDTMVSAIQRGIVDLIGAARPSIADPFLPTKVEEGRIDDIRECIGCNICVAWSKMAAPSRCTQNPTFGEEWRKDWHPEVMPPASDEAHVLVVGAGPAGLEAARAAGQRGYRVTLAEAEEDLGGRVTRECRLPGLAAWARVRDWRLGQIQRMPNVEVYRSSRMTAQQIVELAPDHVAVATGARWRPDGYGHYSTTPVAGSDASNVLTPDDIIEGRRPPEGPVLVYDDDHYYMANVLAELLRGEGYDVMLATPSALVAEWSEQTLERDAIEERLLEAGVDLLPRHQLLAIESDEVTVRDLLHRRERQIPVAGVVMVTARLPIDELFHELVAAPELLAQAQIGSVRRIGDCHAPGIIATAVYEGHRYAREIGVARDEETLPFRRERHVVEPLGAA